MSTVKTGAVGGAFVGSATCPVPTEPVTAATIQVPVQAILNDAAFLNADKLSKSLGGTVAGAVTWNATQTFNGTSGGNHHAIIATGVGDASGVEATGGPTDGPGVNGTGGGTNGTGVQGGGLGTGAGVSGASAGSGPGVKALALNVGVALEVGTGNAKFSGASPAATADPGVDNYLCGVTVPKAIGCATSALGIFTLHVGTHNIASIVMDPGAGHLFATVTFARPMGNSFYVAVPAQVGPGFYWVIRNDISKIAGSFAISVYDHATDTAQNLILIASIDLTFPVFGFQA